MMKGIPIIGGAGDRMRGLAQQGREKLEAVTTIPATGAIYTAIGTFIEADHESKVKLVDEVLRCSPDLIKPETLLGAGKRILDMITELAKAVPVNQLIAGVINSSLELVESAVYVVTPDRLLQTVKKLTAAILHAFIGTVGELPVVKDAVFSNDINAATLGLIWSNGAGLARFIVDLVECTKCYVPNTSIDGVAPSNEDRVPANELDFSNPMNRHAAVCQLQRLGLSIIFILTRMTSQVNLNDIELIGMSHQTRLKSDKNSSDIIQVLLERMEEKGAVMAPEGAVNGPPLSKKGKSPQKLPDSGQKGTTDETDVEREKWFFINGIAGEYHWTRLACQKLAKRFSRDITGIFNRGDGILWDLVECAGERSAQGSGTAKGQKKLIQRTESSLTAQKELERVLEDALDQANGHIVMVAHSQGCLLLRLVLEDLLMQGSRKVKAAMRNWLCVFTFGNPSIDWAMDECVQIDPRHPPDRCESCAGKNESCRHLQAYVHHTEHFANSADFVAKLGVLNGSQDSGYDRVFINEDKDWIGHLFGAQYSLDKKDYGTESDQASWLLNCENGESMADVQKKLRLYK